MRCIIKQNAHTSFGLKHDFATLETLEDYTNRIPIRSYEEFEPWITRVAGGEPNVLTHDPIVAFEQTGGSASGRKLVPYTEAQLKSFGASVLPWLESLLARRPAIRSGKAYVAVSPKIRMPARTSGGLQIGLPSEGAYLGQEIAPAFGQILVNGMAAGRAEDLREWQLETLCDLVVADNLSFVSVWSPTFVTRLVDILVNEADAVMEKLGKAAGAKKRFASALAGGNLRTKVLWPNLDTISCWTDGPSKIYSKELARRFPQVHFEPKGLLATESPITIPLGFAKGNVPALSSVFLEFIDPSGRSHLANDVNEGIDYRIVLTTWGGLYRYDIGDIVRCNGHKLGVPLFTFVGRAGLVSDLVGEKLTDEFVSRVLADLPCATMLVARNGDVPFYELWVDGDLPVGSAAIEARLRANPQYSHARDLGQLGAMAVVSTSGFVHTLHQQQVKEGRRLGDLKAQALLPLPGQARQPMAVSATQNLRSQLPLEV